MDTYEGAARLEWWANRNTCLYTVGVRVAVVSEDSEWQVSATFAPPLTSEAQEPWLFFMALSPYFTLRFDDDDTTTIDVHVEHLDEGTLTLSAA